MSKLFWFFVEVCWLYLQIRAYFFIFFSHKILLKIICPKVYVASAVMYFLQGKKIPYVIRRYNSSLTAKTFVLLYPLLNPGITVQILDDVIFKLEFDCTILNIHPVSV